MKFAVTVEINGIEGIADPEGLTIERALVALGYEGVEGVRVGKLVRFVLEAPDVAAARAVAESLCDRLLANPVIERYAVRVAGEGDADRAEGAGEAGGEEA
jgi:phosphoribosylformylglycinamidine synthase PurS subunit